MRMLIATVVIVLLGAGATEGQVPDRRFYAAATTSIDGGNRGDLFVGALPTAGLLFGVRLSRGWSLEAEVDQGFQEGTRSAEDFWTSFPPTPSTNREEFERYGVKARFDRTQSAGTGWSAHVLWRTREPSLVNAGLFGGVSGRAYDSRVVRTPTFVSPLINLPPAHPALLPEDTSRRMNAGGFTGGVIVLVRTTDRLTIAPEFRFTKGFITDDPYTAFKLGVRAMWAF
jgi:hypothetical protein